MHQMRPINEYPPLLRIPSQVKLFVMTEDVVVQVFHLFFVGAIFNHVLPNQVLEASGRRFHWFATSGRDCSPDRLNQQICTCVITVSAIRKCSNAWKLLTLTRWLSRSTIQKTKRWDCCVLRTTLLQIEWQFRIDFEVRYLARPSFQVQAELVRHLPTSAIPSCTC